MVFLPFTNLLHYVYFDDFSSVGVDMSTYLNWTNKTQWVDNNDMVTLTNQTCIWVDLVNQLVLSKSKPVDIVTHEWQISSRHNLNPDSVNRQCRKIFKTQRQKYKLFIIQKRKGVACMTFLVCHPLHNDYRRCSTLAR